MSSPFASAIYRYVPAIDSLRTYSFGHFKQDMFAGLTVAAVAVPQAMAYASIFGMPVEMGLYTAIIMTAVGALLDSSKQLINGPTNAISIAMFSALSIVPDDQRVSAAIMMAFFIGLIQTSIALLRFGDLSRFISHSVIVGFTLGASVLLFLDQLKNVFQFKGKAEKTDHFLVRFWSDMTNGGNVHWPTVGIAVMTIASAVAIRQLNKRYRLGLPELLLAIALSAVVVVGMDPNKLSGILLQPAVPRTLPSFECPPIDWGLARNLSSSAAAIAFLGLLEAMAMAKSIASKTGQKLDMNQQCLSEGLANMAGSFFRCFPGSGVSDSILYQSHLGCRHSMVRSDQCRRRRRDDFGPRTLCSVHSQSRIGRRIDPDRCPNERSQNLGLLPASNEVRSLDPDRDGGNVHSDFGRVLYFDRRLSFFRVLCAEGSSNQNERTHGHERSRDP